LTIWLGWRPDAGFVVAELWPGFAGISVHTDSVIMTSNRSTKDLRIAHLAIAKVEFRNSQSAILEFSAIL